MTDHLFVYGSLRAGAEHALPAEGRRMNSLLRERARRLGKAVAPGRLHLLEAWYPGMTPPQDPAEVVVGDLFAFDDATLLTLLDEYEEVEDGLYRRTRLSVRSEDGREVDAWAYLYARPLLGARRLPSGDFLETGSPE